MMTLIKSGGREKTLGETDMTHVFISENILFFFGNMVFILSTSIFFMAFQNVGNPRSSWTQKKKDGPFASKLRWGTM